MKILVLDGFALNPGDLSWQGIRELGTLVVYDRTEPSRLLNRIGDAQVILVNKCPISRETIEACPNLKLICVTATGYNTIDLEAAKEHGVLVCNVPTYATESVTQHVFAMLLAVTNRISEHVQSVKAGDWQKAPDFSYWKTPITEIAGMTMGIIGTGRIGMSVAKVAKAFGMQVLCYNGNHPHPEEEDDQLHFVSREELLENADVISLHCPLTEETDQMICKDSIAKMKQRVIIINTARGKLIDSDALIAGLESSKIGAAGLDVLENENGLYYYNRMGDVIPNPELAALRAMPNVILTDHTAFYTYEDVKSMVRGVLESAAAFAEGSPSRHDVTDR